MGDRNMGRGAFNPSEVLGKRHGKPDTACQSKLTLMKTFHTPSLPTKRGKTQPREDLTNSDNIYKLDTKISQQQNAHGS